MLCLEQTLTKVAVLLTSDTIFLSFEDRKRQIDVSRIKYTYLLCVMILEMKVLMLCVKHLTYIVHRHFYSV